MPLVLLTKLLIIMEDLGYSHDAIAVVGNIYSQSTIICVGEHFGITRPIHIQKGNHTKRCMSPYIFMIFLEPLLTCLQRVTNEFPYKTSSINLSFATYVDDQATITNTLPSLQNQLNNLINLQMGRNGSWNHITCYHWLPQ